MIRAALCAGDRCIGLRVDTRHEHMPIAEMGQGRWGYERNKKAQAY